MTVQINPVKPPPSDFEEIVGALNVVEKVLGIKNAFDRSAIDKDLKKKNQMDLEALQRDTDREKAFAEGKFDTPQDRAYAEKQGLVFTTPDSKVADSTFQTPDGNSFGVTTAGRYGQTKEEEATERAAIAAANTIAKQDKVNQDKKVTALRTEYTKASKDTAQALVGFNKVKKASALGTGAGDVALIFGFMKTIDPNSTVREGEFATAQNTGSVPEVARSWYNRAMDGERLTDDQRQRFVEAARNEMIGRLESQKITDKRFADIANKAGIDDGEAEMLILDKRYENALAELNEELGNTMVAGQPPAASEGGVTTSQPFDPAAYLKGP